MYTLEELYSYEEEGRRIALEYMDRADRIAYGRIRGWLNTIGRVFDEVISTLVNIGKVDENDGYYLTIDYYDAINNAKDAVYTCMSLQYPPRECDVAKSAMEEYNELHKGVFGSGCAWGLDSPMYNLSFALNDLTSCYHSALEEFAKYISKPIGRKGYETKGATENAVEFCRLWDKYSEAMMHDYLYYGDDYEELTCIAKKDMAQLRVGSATGHRTIVDFEQGELTYFDTDVPVNLVMMHLFEKLGLKCELGPYSVDCYGLDKLDKDKIDKLAKYIAAATSMDIRIEELTALIENGRMPYEGRWADAYQEHPEIRECFNVNPYEPLESYSELTEKIGITGKVATEIESSLTDTGMLAVAIEACSISRLEWEK